MPRGTTVNGDPTKLDWYCKRCPDDRNKDKKFRNFGRNVRCFKCNVVKGTCFHSEIPLAPARAPTRSLATRQVGQQKEADKVAKLEAKLREQKQVHRQELQRLAKANATAADAEAEEDAAGAEQPAFEYTVAELLAQKRMFLDQRTKPDDPRIQALDEQMALQRKAKFDMLPGDVRIRGMDKQVKMAQVHLEKLLGKGSKLQDVLAAAQKEVADHATEVEKAKARIADAEKARMQLWATVKPEKGCNLADREEKGENDVLEEATTNCACVLAAAQALPDELFATRGANKSHLVEAFQNMANIMQNFVDDKAKQKEAAAEKAAASATEAAAAATKERERWANVEVDDSDNEDMPDVEEDFESKMGSAETLGLTADKHAAMAAQWAESIKLKVKKGLKVKAKRAPRTDGDRIKEATKAEAAKVA